ncbi:hypothetical protein PG984_015068 [Apiospora sp. TS-2023a]
MNNQDQPRGSGAIATKFAALHAAIASGEYREPEEPRYPVIIAADSPMSSPEKLQALVGLPELPKIITIKQVDHRGVTHTEPVDGQEFQICDVDFDEWRRVKEALSTELSVFLRGWDPEKAGTDDASVATVDGD